MVPQFKKLSHSLESMSIICWSFVAYLAQDWDVFPVVQVSGVIVTNFAFLFDSEHFETFLKNISSKNNCSNSSTRVSEKDVFIEILKLTGKQNEYNSVKCFMISSRTFHILSIPTFLHSKTVTELIFAPFLAIRLTWFVQDLFDSQLVQEEAEDIIARFKAGIPLIIWTPRLLARTTTSRFVLYSCWMPSMVKAVGKLCLDRSVSYSHKYV